MNKMKILLIEDDVYDCELYKRYAEKDSKCSLGVVNGIKEARVFLKNHETDVILLDLEFNNSDGSGIEFLRMLPSFGLKIKPYIIITTNNVSKRTHDLARKNGADYIFIKSKIDYTPQAVIDFAFLYYSSLNELALSEVKESNAEIIQRKITRTMESLGITNDMKGKEYLVDAISMVSSSEKPIDLQLSKDIYPFIARKYKKSDQSIEKAIGNAIKKAWRVTDLNALSQFYTAEVSYVNGFPTNKEFIYYIADKVKV